MSNIEKRHHRRINYKLKADVCYDSKHSDAMIENFSETGIFKIVFPEKSLINFYPGETIRVIFQIPSGQKLNLECEIKWIRIQRGAPLFLKYNMGVQIIKPSPEYEEFVKDLLEKSKA
jgi:hypothetical protein